MTKEEWNHKALRFLVRVAYCWLRTKDSTMLIEEAIELLKENK